MHGAWLFDELFKSGVTGPLVLQFSHIVSKVLFPSSLCLQLDI